jgi:hypothetical protein
VAKGKLTKEQRVCFIGELRGELAQGTLTWGKQSRYAEKYQVSRAYVHQIVNELGERPKLRRNGTRTVQRKPFQDSKVGLAVRSIMQKDGLEKGQQADLARNFQVSRQRVSFLVKVERERARDQVNP